MTRKKGNEVEKSVDYFFIELEDYTALNYV